MSTNIQKTKALPNLAQLDEGVANEGAATKAFDKKGLSGIAWLFVFISSWDTNCTTACNFRYGMALKSTTDWVRLCSADLHLSNALPLRVQFDANAAQRGCNHEGVAQPSADRRKRCQRGRSSKRRWWIWSLPTKTLDNEDYSVIVLSWDLIGRTLHNDRQICPSLVEPDWPLVSTTEARHTSWLNQLQNTSDCSKPGQLDRVWGHFSLNWARSGLTPSELSSEQFSMSRSIVVEWA